MTKLTERLTHSLLKQQDDEFQGFSATNPLLHSLIAESPEEELYEAGVRELKSDDPRRRILGIRLIRELKSYRDQATVALTEALKSESDAAVTYWLVSAFGFIKCDDRVAAQLRQHSADNDPAMRYAVATALANCVGPNLPTDSLEVLLSLSRDEDAAVRFSAVFELGSWWLVNHEPWIESELRWAALEDEDSEVASAAQYALVGRQP
jgi:HEAT repeat protein